jgi:hypothetical protein
MNTCNSTKFRVVLFSTLLGASTVALADPTVMMDQSGKAGPKQAAVLACVDAARTSLGADKHPTFSRRVTMEASKQNVKSVTLNGSIWEAGKRVEIQARCVSGENGELVATVTHGATAIAKQ